MEWRPGSPNRFNRRMIKTQEVEEFFVVSRIFLIFRSRWNCTDVHGFSVIPDLSSGLARIRCLFRAQAKQSPIFIGWAQATGNTGACHTYSRIVLSKRNRKSRYRMVTTDQQTVEIASTVSFSPNQSFILSGCLILSVLLPCIPPVTLSKYSPLYPWQRRQTDCTARVRNPSNL